GVVLGAVALPVAGNDLLTLALLAARGRRPRRHLLDGVVQRGAVLPGDGFLEAGVGRDCLQPARVGGLTARGRRALARPRSLGTGGQGAVATAMGGPARASGPLPPVGRCPGRGPRRCCHRWPSYGPAPSPSTSTSTRAAPWPSRARTVLGVRRRWRSGRAMNAR